MVLGIGAAGVFGARAEAQAVRVSVRDSVAGAPVAEALVGLRRDDGKQAAPPGAGSAAGLAAEGLTGAAGVRTLGVPAGRYRVEVRRIGFRPFVGPRVTVAAADTAAVVVALPRTPVTLTAVAVRGSAACPTAAAPEVLELWEAARTALATSAAARGGAAMSATAYQRTLDVAARPLGERRVRVRLDSGGAGGGRVFQAADPAVLEDRGFVIGTLLRGAQFYGPDEHVLLSDAFARTHCFAPARGGGPEGRWLGVRFTPAPARRVAEVAGVVWLDSATAEPRRVEFDYVWPLLPPDARGVGGYAEFARLPSGAVGVRAWQIRIPKVAGSWRGLHVTGYDEVGGQLDVPAGGATQPAAPRVRVAGTVYDSLLGASLPGALVTRAGEPAVGLTDPAGRFTLDDVEAGPGVFVFSHPALDSVGLADLVAPADLPGRDTSGVGLATPSFATIWARMCGGAAPAGRVGLLTGVVRDARTGAPVGGGIATVAWTTVDTVAARVAPTPHTRPVRADSAGAFRVCGVPVGLELEVQGAAERSASGWGLVTVGPRRLGAVDLLVPPLAVDTAPVGAGAAGAAAAARPAVVTTAVSGVVRDSLGVTRSGVRVAVDGVPGVEATTDAEGRFRLANVPAGTQTLVVRAVGYAPTAVSVALRASAPEPVEVTLRPVVRLTPVSVRAARRGPNAFVLDQIAWRRRLGLASVIDSTDIMQSVQLRTAFMRVPFTRVQPGRQGTWQLAVTGPTGGPCPLLVAVDGRLTQWDEVTDLPPWYVLAVEVYRRTTLVPAEFQGLIAQAGGLPCGLAVVWTRNAR